MSLTGQHSGKAGPIRPRCIGTSLIRLGVAGLLVVALELCALEPAQEVLNPEAMVVLGDQPGDGGGGVGHLEGSAVGAGEGRQLWRQQCPDAFLQGGDGGWIESRIARGAAQRPGRRIAGRRLGPGDGGRSRGVPGAIASLPLIPGRPVEGSRDRIGLGRAAPGWRCVGVRPVRCQSG